MREKVRVLERRLIHEGAVREKILQRVKEEFMNELKLQETRIRVTAQKEIDESLEQNTTTLCELAEDVGRVRSP